MLALERSSGQLSLRIIVAVMLIVLVLIASIPSLLAVSEAPSVEWSKTYSGLQANSVIQTADGGYAIVGYTATTPTVLFTQNASYLYYYGDYVNQTAVLVKTDSSGELQWKKEYGTDVFGDDNNAVSVVQTKDLGYMLFGRGGYLVKTDAEGNVQWNRTLGLEVHVIGARGVRVGIQTSDGDYVLVGNTIEINGENVAWLLKTDEQGNILWNKTFTGGVTVYAVIETNDRGCAIAGSWRNNFWFAKIDSNSNLQWSQTYSYGETTDLHYVSSITKTKDGGYMLAGAGIWQASGGLVPWLIKINSQGHEQWSLPYGQITNNGFSSIVQTDDEGYMVALSDSAVLIRTDTSGSEQWNMTYADTSAENTGALSISVLPLYHSSSLIRTKDGGYAIAGTVFESTTWLTKISPEPDVWPPIVSVSNPKNKTYDTGNISLTFTVNEPASWIGYSLDGHDNATITANITLSGLSNGAHNLTVYAKDIAGNIGASETIHFTIVDRFPTEWIVASVVIVAVVGVGLLVRFKKQSLKRCFKKQTLTAIANNNLVRTLTIISLCIILVLVQIFFPCFYFSSASRHPSSQFEVGVSYVYERDNVGQIYDEVSRIHDLGIRIIRVNMVCDSTELNDYLNGMTDVFFAATQRFNMRVALVIQNNEDTNEIQYYLNRWGNYLSYVQILNEPESSSSWDIGALFTDDEAISKFEHIYSIVKQHHLSAQLYTNFGAGFIVRSNLPIQFSEKLDFIGFDVFMESFLVLSPNFIQLLHKITNKDVVITEFGMSTSDDTAQSDYIIRGLNLFKNMGLKGCWIVYWNSADNYYGIRGRLAEKTAGEWIAQNAKTS
ncbi:hypothetical protein MUO79_05910, partial [Candidatus Bathyarchaeota archaeon]|nr:hypothetical protein [Candidatus Bathyarchaeota archaeon]